MVEVDQTVREAMSESDIQKSILDYLNTVVGIRAWRRNVGAFTGEYKGKKRFVRFSQAGQADIWGIGPHGIHCEFEIKADRGVLSEPQRQFLCEVLDGGGIAMVCHSVKECAIQLEAAYVERGFAFNRHWRVS
jgi:hypothetical protein